MESLLGKAVSQHACNCTKKDAITGVSPQIDFVNKFFFSSSHSCIRSDMFYKIGLLVFSENLQENT